MGSTNGSNVTDVVVVGAGVRGTSIAYHLARAGVRVIVVDKGYICSGVSGASFALINVSGKTPQAYTCFSLASADLYPRLSEELGCDIEYQRGSQIYTIIEAEKELAAARQHAEKQTRVPGLEISVLTRQEVREFEPAVATDIAGGMLCHQDGHLNPFALTFGYANAAKRFGAKFLTYTEVLDIEVHSGRVAGVQTSNGRIACSWVVNAAGIGAPSVGSMVGIDVPIIASRGQVITTNPLPGLLRQPLGSLKPNKTGPILIGTTNEFVGEDSTVEPGAISRNIGRAMRIVPALKGASMLRAWAGLRPFPIDGLPIIGPTPEVEGFLIATGHSGFTTAQATGRVIQELITDGKTTIEIDEFLVSRFREGRYHYLRHLMELNRHSDRPRGA